MQISLDLALPAMRKRCRKCLSNVNHPDGSTSYTDINGDVVTYNSAGYPDFSPHAIDQVDNLRGMNGIYSHDEALANAPAGYSKTPDGYVWYHVEDGLTMQLVPK